MTQLPFWAQYLAALATPIVALMVAAVAFLQWRTAHQNVVLSLFDRRMRMVDELYKIVAEILVQNKFGNGDSARFLRATKGVEFLFGHEVKSYLDQIYKTLVDLHYYKAELEAAKGSERRELVKEQRKAKNELSAFFRTFTALVAPYVRMHQKQFWF